MKEKIKSVKQDMTAGQRKLLRDSLQKLLGSSLTLESESVQSKALKTSTLRSLIGKATRQ